MRNWKVRLELIDLWEKFDAEEITVGAVAFEASQRIRALSFDKFDDPEYAETSLEDIAEDLAWMEDDDTREAQDNFNFELNRLYNVADEIGLWVATQF